MMLDGISTAKMTRGKGENKVDYSIYPDDMVRTLNFVKRHDSSFSGYQLETGEVKFRRRSLYWISSFLNRFGYAVNPKTNNEDNHRPACIALYSPDIEKFAIYALSIQPTGEAACVEAFSEKRTYEIIDNAFILERTDVLRRSVTPKKPILDLATTPAVGVQTFLSKYFHPLEGNAMLVMPKDESMARISARIFEKNIKLTAMKSYSEFGRKKIPV